MIYTTSASFCFLSLLLCDKSRIVSDPPIVTLRLGSTLNADDIKEGDDVYFECHVKANPIWRRLTWLHDVSIIICHGKSNMYIDFMKSTCFFFIKKNYKRYLHIQVNIACIWVIFS